MNLNFAKFKPPKFWMPLLAKELTEQAARPRTYLLRGGWALALFGIFIFMAFGVITDGGRISVADASSSTGGQGLQMFRLVIILQLLGVFVFLPAMLADSITSERDSGTLELLIITGLSSWQIILQKLGGRVIPILTLLMLCLPLLAVSYMYSGVEFEMLFIAGYTLPLTALQVGAIALQTAVGSGGAGSALVKVYLKIPIVLAVLTVAGGFLAGLIECFGAHDYALPLVGMFSPAILLVIGDLWGVSIPAWQVVLFTLPTYYMIYRTLRTATVNMDDCVNYQPSHNAAVLMEDVKADQRHYRQKNPLPADHPIAWRERTGKWIIQARYLFIFLFGLSFYIMCLELGTGGVHDANQSIYIMYIIFILTFIAIPTLALLSAELFASERHHQTLDMLLATPLGTGELIRQKTAGVAYLTRMLTMLFGGLILGEFITELIIAKPDSPVQFATSLLHPLFAAAFIALFLSLAKWFGLWIGLRSRHRLRMIVNTLGVFLFLTLAMHPILELAINFLPNAISRHSAIVLVYAFYPPHGFLVAEQCNWHMLANEWTSGGMFTLLAVSLNLGMLSVLLLFFRRSCLKTADKRLGRIAEPKWSPPKKATLTPP